jgi:hypothetical protein
MEKHPDPRPRLHFLERSCRHLSDEERRQAQADFWGYVEIARGIFERREGAPDGAASAVQPRAESTDRPPQSTII